MSKQLLVSEMDVRAALEAWIIAARAGETLGAKETAALSATECAEQSSEFFFGLLAKTAPEAVPATLETTLEAEPVESGAPVDSDDDFFG